MCADVAEEVVDDLAQALSVAQDDEPARAEVDRPLRLHRLRRLDRLGEDLVELHRLLRERTAFVEPREEQEVVDEHAHPLRLARDPGHRARQVVGPPVGAAPEELRIRANGRERRAQLVRRVGDETAEPLLGGLPRGHLRLDLVQHPVQREPEPSDLGALVGALDAAREVAGGDCGRGLLDRPQRPQPEPDRPEPERRERCEDAGRHEQLDHQQPVERTVDAAQRARDDHDLVAEIRLDRRTHAVAAAAGAGGHRQEAEAVAAAAVRRLRERDRFRHDRRDDRLAVGESPPDPRRHDRAVGVADLHERDPVAAAERRRVVTRPPALRLVVEHPRGAGVSGRQGRIHAIQEERAQRRVRRDVGDPESDRRQQDHAQHEDVWAA